MIHFFYGTDVDLKRRAKETLISRVLKEEDSSFVHRLQFSDADFSIETLTPLIGLPSSSVTLPVTLSCKPVSLLLTAFDPAAKKKSGEGVFLTVTGPAFTFKVAVNNTITESFAWISSITMVLVFD